MSTNPTQQSPNEKQRELSTSDHSSETAHGHGHDFEHPATHFAPKNQVINSPTPESEKIELIEEDCYDELGFSFSSSKKWLILSVIFLVQTSMNFNTSLYSNAINGISQEFHVSEQAARVGAAVFLITYAFGCEIFAPWSEEFGRWPILQLSLGLVNIWNLPVALAPNFGSIIVARALGGLCTAGGSVTLGMVADIFESDNQQFAVAFIVFSSVGGSVLGPVVGGFVQQFLPWRWCIWIQLIFGVAVQIAHAIIVPETRTTVMMTKIAKKRRAQGQEVYGPNELLTLRERFPLKEILITWYRPFKMFLTEPIVLTLSLLSGFSDALIFMQIQSFSLVYKTWNFTDYQIGLAFLPILIGYFIAWGIFVPGIRRNRRQREEKPDDEHAQYESRMCLLLFTAPCLPIGLIIFAWTCGGPPLHWIGSMFGSAIIGIANYSIYMATVDYMICAYGPYAASATGGNGWSRDFLAGVLTVPATPFYTNIGSKDHLQYANTILFCIASLLVVAVYVIYWKGPVLRKRSPFAQQLADSKNDPSGRDLSAAGVLPHSGPHSALASRRSSYAASRYAATRSHNSSRRNSFTGADAQEKGRPSPNSRGHSHTLNMASHKLTQGMKHRTPQEEATKEEKENV